MNLRSSLACTSSDIARWGLRSVLKRQGGVLPGRIAMKIDPELLSDLAGLIDRSVVITGTNGKTTTVTLLYDLVRALGHKAGLISTVVYKVGERTVGATHTTPDPVRLNAMMREMADEGCEYCFMECSSHAIVQERTRGLHFAGGIFSNITHDHLDYHKTFAEYIRAKKLFFDSLSKLSLIHISEPTRPY